MVQNGLAFDGTDRVVLQGHITVVLLNPLALPLLVLLVQALVALDPLKNACWFGERHVAVRLFFFEVWLKI